jgi:hypothetical protein
MGPTSSMHSLTPRRGDSLGEAFDDRRLADPRLAGEDRVVLPAAHKHIDDLPDFVVAAENRVHAAGLGLGRKVLAETIERGRAFGARRGGRSLRARGGHSGAVHRAKVSFLRSLPYRAVADRDLVDRNFGEFLRHPEERAPQLDRFEHRHQKVAGADLRLAEQQRRIVPAPIKRVRDLVRDAGHLSFVLAEAVHHRRRVGEQFGAAQLEAIRGQGDIGPVFLQKLEDPMTELNVAVARGLGLPQS